MFEQMVARMVEDLKAVPAAANRVGEIINRTASAEDGETIYARVEDMAEVYAILYMALTTGKADLEAFMANLKESTNGRTISSAGVYPVISYDEEDGVGEYGKLVKPEGTLWLDVSVSLT